MKRYLPSWLGNEQPIGMFSDVGIGREERPERVTGR
jgi:hypothetical protein